MTHEQFTITPTGDFASSEWEFRWSAVSLGNDRQSFEIAATRTLDMEMTLDEGDYTLVFRAKDMKTGVFWEKQAKLEVREITSEGWMVLCDADGESRLDFVSAITGRTYTDILDRTFTGPHRIFYSYYAETSSPFYLTSDECTTRLSRYGFAWKDEFLLDYEMGEGKAGKISAMEDGAGDKIMISDGQAYHAGCTVSIGLFGAIEGAEDLAPAIGVNRLTRNIVVPAYLLYDTKEKRFLGYAPNLATSDLGYNKALNEMNDLVSLLGNMDNGGSVIGTAFQKFPQGYDFVHMESTIYDPNNTSMGMIYTVLKDGNSFYVYGIQLGEMWGAVTIGDCTCAIGRTLYKDISSCTSIAKAEHFAFSPMSAMMYYSVGGSIYSADLSVTKPTAKKILSFDGEQVTVLKFQKYEDVLNYERQFDLIVGSVTDSGNGTLRVYEGYTSGGSFSSVQPQTVNGLGNIVDVSYRENLN